MDSNSQEQMAVVVAEAGHDSVSESGFPFPYWTPACRRFCSDASFFASGSIERELLAKQVALDLTEDERYHLEDMEDGKNWSVFCPIVGCGARLNPLEDFEDHYNARHTASCSVCSRVYPTSRLLSIHVSEAHDSFFQAKVARGIPSYECLVEGCGVKLKSYKSRQQHLVDKHKFPASFEFFKKKAYHHPSKKQRQKFQRKQARVVADDNNGQKRDDDDKMEVEETMDGLVLAVSKLSTTSSSDSSSPSSISFGRRHTRGFAFLPRSVQRERKQEASSAGTKKV
ncbi:zinc finger protein 511 [Telopea speciosissima]|uniref:zinc finger protein 511 n=1 Tax=Telopea speciosissima TaxID=54955 RepID=UPI001CC4922B|nr:zinc finger protein 511 [Telopea speciosissima]